MAATPRITLRLEDNWRKELEQIAKAQGVRLSDVLRQAIADYVNHNKAKQTP